MLTMAAAAAQSQEILLNDPAELLARVFHGLSDPTRMRLVQLLLEGEQNVGEIVAALGTSQGRVSAICCACAGAASSRLAGRASTSTTGSATRA